MNLRGYDVGAIGWGLYFIAGGIVFLLNALGVWHVGADITWPSLVIAFGAAAIARGVQIEREKGPFH
jgi:hypothetical protein